MPLYFRTPRSLRPSALVLLLWLVALPLFPADESPTVLVAKKFFSLLVNKKYLTASRMFDIPALAGLIFSQSLEGLDTQEKYRVYRCLAFYLSHEIRNGLGETIAIHYQDPSAKVSDRGDDLEKMAEMEYKFLERDEKIRLLFTGEGETGLHLTDLVFEGTRLSEKIKDGCGAYTPIHFIDLYKPFIHLYNTYQLNAIDNASATTEIPHYFTGPLDAESPKIFAAFNNELTIEFRVEFPNQPGGLDQQAQYALDGLKEGGGEIKLEKFGKVPIGKELGRYLVYRRGDILEELALALINGKKVSVCFKFGDPTRRPLFDPVRRRILEKIAIP